MKCFFVKSCFTITRLAGCFCLAFVIMGVGAANADETDVKIYEDVDALDDLEDDEIAFYQDSSQWDGTVWLRGIDETQTGGTKLNNLGNADSTIRLTNCEFWIPRDYSVNVPLEFFDNEEDDEDLPAFFINGLSTGIYRLAVIKGDGTFKIRDRNGSNSAFFIEDVSQFTGSLDTDRPVFMGSTTGYKGTSGWIEIPAGQTVTIHEGKYFTSEKILVNGTLVVNGTLNGTVEGTGTVVLPETIASGTDIGVYSSAKSTVKFANDFSGRLSSGCTIAGDLDLGGHAIELTDGYPAVPYVINRLVGDGVINVTWANGTQPITINNVLADDGTTIAYRGRIIGNVNVTLPTGYKLDERGYIIPVSANHVYVTVPRTATGVNTPTATNLTTDEALQDVEPGNSEFIVYRVAPGARIDVTFTAKTGYCFDDFTTVKTVTVTAEANPTVVAGSAAIAGTAVGDGAYMVAKDGACTIFGTGVAANLPSGFNRDSIVNAVVADGVTEIGARFFKNCTNVKTMSFGKDVVTFGEKAFYKCFSLETIDVANKASLASLTESVTYRLMYDDRGNFVVAPKINVPGHVEMLYGKEKLSDGTWTEIGELKDQNLEELKAAGTYHFFQTKLVETK